MSGGRRAEHPLEVHDSMTKHAILYHPRTFHEHNYRYYYIPYSIVSVATTLSSALPCVLIDNNALRCEDPSDLPLPGPNEWGVVGISTMIGHQITDGLKFSEYIKSVAPDCPVVWGGACPTMLTSEVLCERSVDYVVVGQGEATFPELWRTLSSGGDGRQVAGVAIRSGSGITSCGRPLTDLNDLPPYRDWYSQINVGAYIRADEHIASRTVNYHSSQGCAFNCGFCCEPTLWDNKWRGRNAQGVVEDIKPLIDNFGVNGIKFYDSEFFIQMNRVLQFANLVVQQGLPLRWAASIHPRNFLRLTDDELTLLRRSGLSRLLLGAETAMREELRLIKKRLEPSTMEEVARRCARVGVSASFTFVTGYPGFPLENIDRTIEFAETLARMSPRHEAKIHFFGPYPGTPLYQLAIKHGFSAPQNLREWADYDYYFIQTPWISTEYFAKVRQFNEAYYPYLLGAEMG